MRSPSNPPTADSGPRLDPRRHDHSRRRPSAVFLGVRRQLWGLGSSSRLRVHMAAADVADDGGGPIGRQHLHSMAALTLTRSCSTDAPPPAPTRGSSARRRSWRGRWTPAPSVPAQQRHERPAITSSSSSTAAVLLGRPWRRSSRASPRAGTSRAGKMALADPSDCACRMHAPQNSQSIGGWEWIWGGTRPIKWPRTPADVT